ncbi:MAG: Gfo/Idh/MocA family protein [Candidatus Hodarchaeales archaeon]
MSNLNVKICVVGLGRMGVYHTRLLHRLEYLDSVIDTNENLVTRIGQQFGVPYFTSLKEMQKERSPDGLIIAVPTINHFEVAKQVAENVQNVKAILIEKPMASSVEEAEALKSVFNDYDIPIIVGHIEVYNPLISRISKIVNDGLIGNMRSLFFQRRGAVGEEQVQILGDVYQDVGVHDFDIALRLLPKGEAKLYSSSVKVKGVDNSSVTAITSKINDFYSTFLMSREYAGKVRTIDIEGTKATLHANLINQVLEVRSLEVPLGEKAYSAIRVPFSSGEQIKVYGEPLLHEILNISDCIKGKSVPQVSMDDGIKVLKLVEAARKSIQTGETIPINL